MAFQSYQYILMMAFLLPRNALSLHGDCFYQVVTDFCGPESLELLKFQLINSSMDLLEVDDVFSILQIESDQTASLKEILGLHSRTQSGDYFFCVLLGIRLKLERFIRLLRALLPPTDSAYLSITTPLTISSKCVQQYPFLIDLIHCLESNLLTDFILIFLSNMLSNLTSSKHSFRYEQPVKDFAASIFILGGRNVYEFIRQNISGSIPSLPSLGSILTSSKYHFIEGEFQYERLKDFIGSGGCKYAFCGEDCTSVVPRVTYDTRSNCFVGFTLPLKDGFPCSRYFSSDSLSELETWHDQVEKSSLINVHVIQAISPVNQISPPPFLLAAYGTNNKYTALDILNRWAKTFDLCMVQKVRILGFSTDCDPKNLKAMRDSMGFFSDFQTGFEDHPHRFEISLLKKTSWFFLKPRQLFVCLQDGTHLCTKLRNRLLSSNTVLLMGRKCASVNHLVQLIDNHSKIDHGLTISDIYENDKQNYSSCEKITSDAVFSCLKKISNSEATQVYLQIIKFVRLAFVEKNTTVIDRLYYSWCSVFIVRLWSAWLEKTNYGILNESISRLSSADSNTSLPKSNLFITMPAFISIELNAHTLTYLVALVAEQAITEEALILSLFNSQICESMFRTARSMSGPFSSIVNFSVNEFLQRVEKLTVLQGIKYSSDCNESSIIFPKHHKQSKQTYPFPSTSTVTTIITAKMIEDIVFSAYIQASQILSDCQFSILDPNYAMISFDEVNLLAYKKLERSKCVASKKKSVQSSNNNDEEDEDENRKHDRSNKQSNENDILDEYDEFMEINELDLDILPNVSTSTFHGMHIFDSIDDCSSKSFLRVEVNGQKKFMHKQTANWYFSKTKPISSSDRLNRVRNKK